MQRYKKRWQKPSCFQRKNRFRKAKITFCSAFYDICVGVRRS